MGYFWFGLPDYLPTWTREVLGPDTAFIETGTFHGQTARVASETFARVDTIEIDPALHAEASSRLSDTAVRCHLGDSRDVLAEIVPGISSGLLVWLDAHYSGGVTGGVDDPCPIFGELDVLLGRSPDKTVLAVDDVRLFVGLDGYPRLDEVGARLTAANWTWTVIDDVLVATSDENLTRLLETSPYWRQLRYGALGGIWPSVRNLLKMNGKRHAVKHRVKQIIRPGAS